MYVCMCAWFRETSSLVPRLSPEDEWGPLVLRGKPGNEAIGNIHCYCEKVHENCPIPCQLFKTSSATFARACVLFALPTLVAIAIATRTLLLTIKTLEGTRNSLGS